MPQTVFVKQYTAGTPPGSGTAQLQYWRIKPNTGDLSTGEFAELPFLVSSDYDFDAQTPGGTLTGAVEATVTLTPVPLGVNGSDVGHYLYIPDGTVEAVLITGGTAVSGATSGTVIFTPANNHSAGWTIKSATAGIQEAVVNGGARPHVFIPSGTYNLYATITASPAISLTLVGAGISTTTLVPQFVAGDVVFIDASTSGVANVHDFSIVAAGTQVSGALLHAKKLIFGSITDLLLKNGYANLETEQCNDATVGHIQTLYATHTSVYVHTGPDVISAGTYHDIQASVTGATGAVLRITGTGSAAGLGFNNCIFQGGAYNIYADPNGGQLNEVRFSNYSIDGALNTSIKLTYAGAGGTGNGWFFLGGRGGTATAAGVFDVDTVYTNGVISVFEGGTGGDAVGIWLRGVKNWTVGDVHMSGGNSGGGSDRAINLSVGGAVVCDGVNVHDNRLGESEGSSVTRATYGIVVAAGAHTNLRFVNNRARGTGADFSYSASGLGNVFINNDFLTGKPAADASNRGSTWFTLGGGGVADADEICSKSAADAYAWRSRI